MAGLFNDDEESNAATSEAHSIKPAVYGTIESVETRIDSLLEISPVEQPRPGYSFAHQHRIIPPSITGHGRLIIAHRTVPYWAGALFVAGAVAWAVFCALYIYPLMGGHRNDWRMPQ